MAQILIVDDEPGIRMYFGRILEDAGHTVAVARHGKEALEIYAKERQDLVIIDLIMPEMDGIELVKALLALDPEARIITMTGALPTHEPSLKVTRFLGATLTLTKPITSDDLLAAVFDALGE